LWTPQIELLKKCVAEASMRTALKTYVLPDGLKECDPVLLQIALYAQGLKHHKLKTNKKKVTIKFKTISV
jgi:hypothetical protein